MNRILSKTMTVILVLAVLLGMMAPAAMAAGTQASSRVHTWNLVLADKIAVNFNVDLSENVPAGAVMQVTDGYGKTAYPISEAEKNEAGKYQFTADLAAAQLADEIKLEVLSGGVSIG